MALDGGIEITSISDIPSEGTGLGSSSAYTVGLLNVLHAYLGEYADAHRAQGAVGGKILGAGGGGFLLLYAPLIHHEYVIRALPELRQVPFRFEPQGSKIIYVEEPSPDPRTHGVEASTTRIQAHCTSAKGASPYL